MSDMPWFPWYASDFVTSRRVRRMTAEQVGVYVLLLSEEWMGGPIEDDEEELAEMGKAEPAVVRSVLAKCFTLTEAGWINERLEEIRKNQQKKKNTRTRAAKAGAKARWDKGKNANRIATASESQCDSNANRTEQSRTEQSSSVSKDTGQEPAEEFTEGEFAQLVRKHLWQSNDPPARDWNMGREINIRRAMVKKGCDPEHINGVVGRYRGEPTTMRIWWASGARPRWEQDKAAWLNSQPIKLPTLRLGDVMGDMSA